MIVFNKNIKVLMFAFSVLATQLHAMEEPRLGKAFLGQAAYLKKVQGIQSCHTSPTEFMPELEPLVNDMIKAVDAKIQHTPALNQSPETMRLFKQMCQFAQNEFSLKTMNLNRLNYLCLQMNILLNPNLNKPYRILAAFNVFVNRTEGVSGE
jgi:hypothetical protein